MPKHSTPQGPSVPDYLRPVLGQLLSGATDNAASHRLNMSARTFSRRVAELLAFLEVQTRFQAGFEIARRARQRQAVRADATGEGDRR